MTSRELADRIDDLIKLRVIEATSTTANLFKVREQAERAVRDIADAFKRLDHNPGVAAFGDGDSEVRKKTY